MRDRFTSPIPTHVRGVFALLGALLCGLLLPATLRAQETQPPAPDTGTLVVTIKGREATTPPTLVPLDAQIQAESPSTLTQSESTDPNTGIATFKNLKPETYNLTVTTSRQFRGKTVPGVVVKAGETTSIEIVLDPIVRERGIGVERLILNPDDVSNHVERILTLRSVPDLKRGNVRYPVPGFDERFPLNIGNRQNLDDILLSVPGFVRDSINQVHTRGEHSISKAYYMDGFLVPAYQGGRAAQFFLPDTIETVTARVAGLPARYGGGSGAIIDLRLREPQNVRLLDYSLRLGGFNSRELYINLGNSAPLRPRRRGQTAPPDERRINYLISLSQRYTDNALEAPQPDDETAHNEGASELFFGKLSTELAPGKSLSAVFNFSSGRTNIANRTGLGSGFAGFGQGFGFGGFFGPEVGPSQAQQAQNFRQKDNNNLTYIQFRNVDKRGIESTYAIGASKTKQTVIDLGTVNVFGGVNTLPGNNSIEYIPTVGNDADIIQLQADFVPLPILNGVHQLRFGGAFHFIQGTDSFQLIPQSQAAANALAALDPRLAAQPNGFVPVMIADKRGFYGAAYAEDTFQLRNQMRFNIGFRVDSYNMDVNTNASGIAQDVNSNNKTDISPRLNISFLFPERGRIRFLSSEPTILRVSYNRLFAIPGLNQNAVLPFQPGSFGGVRANGVGPQVVDLYDLSIERQLGLNKKVKLTIYSKDIKRTLALEQHIYGLQAGTLAVYNNGNGVADGAEISFDLLPTPVGNGNLISGFFVYGNSGTAPINRNQFNNLGQQVVTPFFDFDQQDTITLGASYQMRNGSSAGLSLYYGSGLASSARKTIFSRVPFTGRDSVTELNLSYNSGPRFLGRRAALEVGIENLFNSQGILNFQAPFAGTRFQQGRRILLGFSGRL
jgi:hypothetical protein